ncbi:MAG: hypothetical protein ACK2UK_22335 [Candidatus Promineifilaceae bacterium]
MSERDGEFKDLANRAYMAYHQDGVIDILLGAGITGFGLNMLFDSPALIVLSWMPFLFYMPLKTHITAPRFGYVRFSGEQEERARYTRLALVGLLAAALFLGFALFMAFSRAAPDVRALLAGRAMVLMGTMAAIILAAAGAATGLKRLYVYAALTLLFNIVGAFLPIHEGVTTVLLGLTIMASGIWLLARFLRTYPKIDEEKSRDGS